MNVTSPATHNLRRYPIYVAGVSALAWLPVFFLYLSSQVTLAQVLVLEAIYYASVVVMEVPSGMFSDRVGRRPTLRLAAGALLLAYVLFAVSGSFAMLAVAQFLLATGLAFNSGTDTSFHLQCLTATGEEKTYGQREARIASLAFVVGAGAALSGGLLALVDMRLAYVASAVGALVAFGAAWSFRTVSQAALPDGYAPIRACIAALKDRQLAWVVGAMVVATVVNHVPYEFYQPYLDHLAAGLNDGSAVSAGMSSATPAIAGVHVAIAQLLASLAARHSVRIADKVGLTRHLLLSLGVQVLLIASMALWVSPVVAVLLLGRSVAPAFQNAPARAAIAPRLAPEIRATFLSMMSLAGRLAFALVLLGLSFVAKSGGEVLSVALGVSASLVVVVTISAALRCRR